MSAKKMGLGRGFESLIPTELLDGSFDPTAEQDEKISDLRQIKLRDIVPDPNQPRQSFDEFSLTELASSIKEHGVLQPIVVTPNGDTYMIVAGERRFRASKLAGLDKIPAIVRTLSNQHRLELSLIENLQRSDLNPVETATAYLKLRDQFNLTLDEIGERVGGKSNATISNTLRLLRLPASVREALAAGQVREGQVRPLINLPIEAIEAVLPKIIAEEWSARAVERYATHIKTVAPDEAKKAYASPKRVNPFPAEVSRIKHRLNAAIQVKPMSKGSGRIVISYKNEKDFQRIAELLGE